MDDAARRTARTAAGCARGLEEDVEKKQAGENVAPWLP
jgi:hypothetical protein